MNSENSEQRKPVPLDCALDPQRMDAEKYWMITYSDGSEITGTFLSKQSPAVWLRFADNRYAVRMHIVFAMEITKDEYENQDDRRYSVQ